MGLSHLVESRFEVPATTIPIVERTQGISYNTARSDIEKLVQIGVLEEVPDRYPRTYHCPEVLRITHSDL